MRSGRESGAHIIDHVPRDMPIVVYLRTTNDNRATTAFHMPDGCAMILPRSTLAVSRIPTPAHAAQCPSREPPHHCVRYAALKPQSHENKSHLSLASTLTCQKESLVMASGIYLDTSKTASARPMTHPEARRSRQADSSHSSQHPAHSGVTISARESGYRKKSHSTSERMMRGMYSRFRGPMKSRKSRTA